MSTYPPSANTDPSIDGVGGRRGDDSGGGGDGGGNGGFCSFCHGFPKLELHAHLGGSIRNETLRDFLFSNHYPDAQSLAAQCIVHGVDTQRSMSEQFVMFTIIGQAWTDDIKTQRIVREFIEDSVKNNIVYSELRTSGSSREKVVSILDTIDAFHQSQNNKDSIFPIIKVVISIKREWNLQEASRALEIALDLQQRGVVGLDFCGNPFSGGFAPFKELFLEAKRRGLKVTVHFAESKNEKDHEEILSILPSRIGHGCFMSPLVEQTVIDMHIPIESCFASNINTMRLFNGLCDHPYALRWRHNPDVLVVPATDNYGILESTLSDHYHMIHQLGATEEELWKISERSIDFIFADEHVKKLLKCYFEQHPLNPKRYK